MVSLVKTPRDYFLWNIILFNYLEEHNPRVVHHQEHMQWHECLYTRLQYVEIISDELSYLDSSGHCYRWIEENIHEEHYQAWCFYEVHYSLIVLIVYHYAVDQGNQLREVFSFSFY